MFTRSGSTWTQQVRLTASDGRSDDRFGDAVALDGNTALVGARQDDVGSNSRQGSAYVFTGSGSSWTQQAQLTAADGAQLDEFGSAVALDGDTALVGANLDDVGANSDQGSAYVFTRSGSSWTQQVQLAASGSSASDRFGVAVALDGGTALVGAQGDDVGDNRDQGSAYVFTRSGSTWIQQARLTAADGAANDLFGSYVDLDGDTALVGAFADDVGANSRQGSAYVFIRSGSSWTQQAQLTAADGAVNDVFGGSVTLDGDTALIGAYADDVGANVNQGSVYVFVRSGSSWTQQAQLTAADGAAGDVFGVSLDFDGDTALIGASQDDFGAELDQGSSYVFTRSGSSWSQQAKLSADDGMAEDYFGERVALDGDTALVGAWFQDVGANPEQGSAYVFSRSGNSWTQQAKLTAADGTADDQFGYWVALQGDTALVGAYSDDVGDNIRQGSAYVFGRRGSSWAQHAKLTAADGSGFDDFGISVALDGDTALIGAWGKQVGANRSQGAAYVFTGISSVFRDGFEP